MKKIVQFLFSLFFCKEVLASQKTIGIYQQYPIADPQCVSAMQTILEPRYKTLIINHEELNAAILKQIDCIVFPGGLGDSDNFDNFLPEKKNLIQKYVASGGKYVGVCMGAFFAGKYYFDILGNTDAVQYVKRKNANVFTEEPTVANCFWLGKEIDMFFYDGAAFIGDLTKYEIVARYSNGDPAAIVKRYKMGIVAAVGPHPESLRYWYDEIKKQKHWHKGKQHTLLIEIFDNIFNE